MTSSCPANVDCVANAADVSGVPLKVEPRSDVLDQNGFTNAMNQSNMDDAAASFFQIVDDEF